MLISDLKCNKQAAKPDPALTETQRQNIRLVLGVLGFEESDITMGEYRKRKDVYDWDKLADNIRNPKYLARCDIVYHGQTCGSIAVEIQAGSEAEFHKKLKNNFPAYRFKEFISVPPKIIFKKL